MTRVAIEVTGDFKFRTDRLHNPERVYFDILNARPRFENRRIYSETIDDKKVQRLRVAETTPGVTRVVLDLAVIGGGLDLSAHQSESPDYRAANGASRSRRSHSSGRRSGCDSQAGRPSAGDSDRPRGASQDADGDQGRYRYRR